MSMSAPEIKALIKEAFPDAVVAIQDLAGDGDHYAAQMQRCRAGWATSCMPLRCRHRCPTTPEIGSHCRIPPRRLLHDQPRARANPIHRQR